MARCGLNSAFYDRPYKDRPLSLTTEEYKRKGYCGTRAGHLSLAPSLRDNLANRTCIYKQIILQLAYTHTSTVKVTGVCLNH